MRDGGEHDGRDRRAAGDSPPRPAADRYQPDDFAIFTPTCCNVMGGVYQRYFHLYGRGFERRPDGGRRRRDEHHAGERDGADAGDRRAQGDRRDQANIMAQFTLEAMALSLLEE